MSDNKIIHRRVCSLLASAALIIGCGAAPAPAAKAAELSSQNDVYLCEAFNIAGGNFYTEPRSQWIKFLDKYSASDYYIGTPYDEWLYSASPQGDKWQLDEGYSSYIISGGGSAKLGGMNSNGFIWHAIAKSLSEGSGRNMAETGKCVPMLSGFNADLFSRPSWQGGSNRWSDFISKYNVRYYEFDTKADMLSSGVLGKGDIIWCVDGAVGKKMEGLSIPADNHHVGIYMGSGCDDIWWQTGPTKGDGDMSEMFNSINPIYGCAKSNTYVVLPWDGVHTECPPPVTYTVTTVPETTPPVVTTTTVCYHERSTRNITDGLKNPEGQYFNDGIKAASGGKLTISLEQWQSFITKYTSNDYYVGTPYSIWLYAASPNGDKWQFDEGCTEQIISTGGTEENGGLNCMAFVWHALSLGLAEANGLSIEDVSSYIPFNDEFNTLFTRKAWGGYGGWLSFMNMYDLRYYEFDSKSEMLSSGALRKGDIIWCVDGYCGTGLSGLRTLSDNHHIGIYTGDGTSDQWWQSGPTLGDNNFDEQKNSVNPLYGCAVKNTYVVIPFGDEIVCEAAIPQTTTAVNTTTSVTSTTQTAAYNCGDIDNNKKINSVDASMVLTYYAMISTKSNGNLSDNQKKAADVDKNGVINAADASNILSYYTYTSTIKDSVKSFEEYMKT